MYEEIDDEKRAKVLEYKLYLADRIITRDGYSEESFFQCLMDVCYVSKNTDFNKYYSAAVSKIIFNRIGNFNGKEDAYYIELGFDAFNDVCVSSLGEIIRKYPDFERKLFDKFEHNSIPCCIREFFERYERFDKIRVNGMVRHMNKCKKSRVIQEGMETAMEEECTEASLLAISRIVEEHYRKLPEDVIEKFMDSLNKSFSTFDFEAKGFVKPKSVLVRLIDWVKLMGGFLNNK